MAVTETIIGYVQQKLQIARTIAKNKSTNARGEVLFKRFPYSRLISYLDSFLDKGQRDQRWVVMPGLRGTGKSTLLAQIYLYLIQDKGIEPADVLYISVDDIVDQLGCGIRDVLESYEAYTGEKLESATRPKIFFIDEAHFDVGWAQTLKEVYERAPNVFLFVTGSSALALQADPNMGADVARRVQLEKIEPLRFAEYLMLRDGVEPINLDRQIGDALFACSSAKEVKSKLDALRDSIVTYGAKFTGADVEKFLSYGSFPYSINLSKEEAFSRIVKVTKEVLRVDIPKIQGKNFDLDTISKFPQLVTLLAAWEDVSIEKLRKTLLLRSPITVTDMVEALKKCEIIHTIPTFGGTAVRTTRPPRYAFCATGVKSAFLWSIGKFIGSPDQYGKLLEDMFVHYFNAGIPRKLFSIFRIENPAEADFILQTPEGEKIACELGYGQKGIEQVKTTMERVSCKYGLVISEGSLEIRNDIVLVPKNFLLSF